MKLKNIVFAVVSFLVSLSIIPQTGMAQMSVGASYEIRDEDPKSGFGMRIERDLLERAPIVNLGLRAHFSYFKENISYKDPGYSNEISNYDYGLSALGGVSVGLISPYIGLGVGASTIEVVRSGTIARPENSLDTSISWNSFVGSKITVLPIQPFVEYRLDDVSGYEDDLDDVKNSTRRLIFGVSLSF